MTGIPQLPQDRLTRIGLVAGPILALIAALILPDTYVDTSGNPQELSFAARAAAGTGTLMAIWWLTEAISLYATALLPLCLFPLFGVNDIHTTASSYGHEIIFLFMGGFILALALERWGLHKRLALNVLSAVGPKPGSIIAAFMGVACLLSMWVTNTATTLMLLPVALSVIGILPGREQEEGSTDDPFSICLLLGIAYAASIGGMGTIVGTAPNVFAVSFIQDQLGRQISFIEWMSFAVPLVILLVPLVWLALTRWIYPLSRTAIPGAQTVLEQQKAALPPVSRAEYLTMIIFACTALAWILRPLLNDLEIAGMRPLEGLSDAGIAMLSATILFLTPVSFRTNEFVMNWSTAVRLPWGMLILFGGGLALAGAIVSTGLNGYLGSLSGGLDGWPAWAVVLAVTTLVVFLTELVSNFATTATLIPVILAVAIGMSLPPLLLILPATFAASCAFMLPVATPPNAIVFGSGRLRIAQMSRAGFRLNFLAIVLITLATYAILVPLLGINL